MSTSTPSSGPGNPSPGSIPPVARLAEPVVASVQPIYLQPQVVIQGQSSGGFFFRFISWLGWAAFGFCFLVLLGQWASLRDYFDTTDGIREKFVSGEEYGDNKVAVISIEGMMISGEGFVKHQIDRVADDDKVKAVVIRVDSPGGTVTSADYMLHHLKKLKDERNLPVVVSMGSIAASGGYYVAMAVGNQERSIFAEPTTTTGSIGVMIPHYDISGLMQKLDVKDDSLATHPRKLMLSMTKPMADDHRQLVAGYLNESLDRFKEIIKLGRPEFAKDPSKLDELATGEIFSANKAKEKGLVDEIGFIEDAIERACELAGIKPAESRVVRFERPLSLLDFGSSVRSPALPQQSISSQTVSQAVGLLLESGVPRPFYLATSIPPLVSTNSN